MSDKLKIMQEPVVSLPMLNSSINQDGGDELWYKVETCSAHTYYVEVIAWQGSLFEVLSRLKSDFNVDASGYCATCEAPFVQNIAVVPASDVPAEGGRLVFVSRLQ